MLKSKDKISYVIQILNGIIPFVIIYYLLNENGLSFMGGYFLSLSIIGVTQVLIDYGFNLSGIRSFAVLIDRSSNADKIWSEVISIVYAKAILVIIASFFCLGYALYHPQNFILALVSYLVGVILSLTNISPLIFAMGRSFHASVFGIAARIIFSILIFYKSNNLYIVIAATFLPILITNLFSLFMVIKIIGKISKVSELDLAVKFQFKNGRSIFLNSALASLISSAWPLILSLKLTPLEMGAYGIADKIIKGLMSFITPLPNFILARNKEFKLAEIGKILLSRRLSIILVFPISFPLLLIVIPYGYVEMIIGNDLMSFRFLLVAYSLGVFFSMTNLLIYTNMIINKKESDYSKIIFIAFLTSIFFGYFLSIEIYMPLIFEVTVAIVMMLGYDIINWGKSIKIKNIKK